MLHFLCCITDQYFILIANLLFFCMITNIFKVSFPWKYKKVISLHLKRNETIILRGIILYNILEKLNTRRNVCILFAARSKKKKKCIKPIGKAYPLCPLFFLFLLTSAIHFIECKMILFVSFPIFVFWIQMII